MVGSWSKSACAPEPRSSRAWFLTDRAKETLTNFLSNFVLNFNNLEGFIQSQFLFFSTFQGFYEFVEFFTHISINFVIAYWKKIR